MSGACLHRSSQSAWLPHQATKHYGEVTELSSKSNCSFSASCLIITYAHTSHLKVPVSTKWPLWISSNDITLIINKQENTGMSVDFKVYLSSLTGKSIVAFKKGKLVNISCIYKSNFIQIHILYKEHLLYYKKQQKTFSNMRSDS